MTPAQRHLADEWLINHNGCRAYKAAYPRVKKDETARVCASQLLTKPNVRAYIKMRHDEMSAKYRIDQERILKEESNIAFSNITDLFQDGRLLPPDKLPDNAKRAISSIKIKVLPGGIKQYEYRFWDKGRALERISKHLGLYEKDNRPKCPSLEEVYAAFYEVSPALAEAVKKGLMKRLDAN